MLLLIAGLLIIAAYILYEYRFRKDFFSLRERIGISGPKPDILSGNISYLFDYVRKHGIEDTPNVLLKLKQQYGDTYGFYIGTTLDIITTDPVVIREVFIGQFSNFTNRKFFSIMNEYPFRGGLLQVGIEESAHGVGWKEIRSVVSAIFTSGKMKKMHNLFHDQLDVFMECLQEKSMENGGIMDIYGEYQALTMDMIARCAFGMEDISCIRDRNNNFYKLARHFFSNFNIDKSPLALASILVPPLGKLRRFSTWGRAERKIVDDLTVVVVRREKERAEGKTRAIPDLIDLILQENEKRAEAGDRPIHRDVVVSNCYHFLLAGYETTSTALSYATWLLAEHSECQERLFEEIVEIFGEKDAIDYDRVMKAQYLNAVMMETLRLKPPVVTFTQRQCIRDTTIGELRIPKGVSVIAPVHVMHLNEDYFEEPNNFQPDRFLSGQTPANYAYIPFGIGPRNCVGARFAEMEFKTVLASVIRRFRFDIDPAEPELKTFISAVLQLPLNNRLSLSVSAR